MTGVLHLLVFTAVVPGRFIVNGMLSKLRVPALLALIVGVALIVVGILLPKMVSSDRPVPLELESSTFMLVDPNATVGANYQGLDETESVQAPVARQFKISLDQPADENEASARVGVTTYRQDVKDDLEALLDAQVFSYRVDRFTGEAVGGAGKVADTPVVPSNAVPMEGYWAKFPTSTEKRTYDYFDVTLRDALPAHFDREETRTTNDGHDVPVYVFRQEIEPSSVKEQYEGIRNEITDPESGEKAQLFHGGWREITVEPKSGLIVGVEEDVKDVYQIDGKEVDTLLQFHGRTDGHENQRMLEQARTIGHQRDIPKWRVALIVAGAIVAAVSLFVVLRSGKRKVAAPKGRDE